MTVAAPTTSNEETVDFLMNLYAGFNDGFVTLFAVHPDRQSTPSITRWASAKCAVDLADDAAQLDGWNLWIGCATRREQLDGSKRGGNKDCLQIPGLWVDVDIAGPAHAATNLPSEDEAWKLITDFPLPPTVIIHSGHGLQPWWIFQEPHELAESDLLARWGTTWARRMKDAGDFQLDNVYDPARIMRLPGTINTKAGCPPVPVTVAHDDWRNRYGIDDIEQWLDPPLPQPRATNNNGIPYIGPERPGDAYNARHTCAEQFAALGFIAGRVERNGDQHWNWPASANDQSATSYSDGHGAIWSTTAAKQLGAIVNYGYDPYGLYAATRHHGDHTAAAAQLRREGYGAPPVALTDLIGTPTAVSEASRWLPADFWTRRPYLTHIRQAAWARTTSPDAVLAAVLARVAANTNHQLAIPPIVGSAGSLNYYAAIIAPSGAGKSTAIAIAEELVPNSILDDAANGLPLGSGEGLAEAFMGERTEDDENGKPKKVRVQVRYNAFVVVDEGAAITAMMDRSGTTILEALRRGWTGQTLGQANASQDRKRIVNNYRLGLVVAFQPELAGRILADHHAGTPQRFIYLSGTNPNIPDDTPDWPGPLVTPPLNPADLGIHQASGHGYNSIHLGIEQGIAALLRRQHRDKARGTHTVNELDSHEPMHRLKTAGILAILDRRLDITTDDWALADTIWNTSCAVRGWLAATAAQAERDTLANRAIGRAQAGIIEDEHRATYDEQRAQKLARNIARHVHEKTVAGGEWEHGATARDLSHVLASRDRRLADDAIQIAIGEQLITVGQGTQTGVYLPGLNRPA